MSDFDPRRVIARKRDGHALEEADLAAFAAGLADATVTDAQGAAFAMAVFLRGLAEEERVALTRAMQESGRTLAWPGGAPVLDKHSTGGVGDCTSLVLAPALAALGVRVPMISGRGLGHTGGTLDKLEAIPGVTTALPAERIGAIVGEIGCVIAAAGPDIAPADRRLYALREESATIESPDLITASILSKKLAEGLDALVLDIKTGSGAFMRKEADARALARMLKTTAEGAGCPTAALVTDMNEPLASAAGNALEVARALDLLTMTDIDNRLWDLSLALGGALLARAGMVADRKAGAARLERVIEEGRAAERFAAMIAAQGGPKDLLERYREILPRAPVIRPVPPATPGFVTAIDTRRLGEIVVMLGGGRRRQGERIDPAVGLSDIAGIGQHVGPETPLATIHAASEAAFMAAAEALRQACVVGPRPLPAPPLILAEL